MNPTAEASLHAEALSAARASVSRLAIFDSLALGAVEQAWLDLVDCLLARDQGAVSAYYRFLGQLARHKPVHPVPAELTDPWQAYLIDRLFYDENPFTLQAERVGGAPLPSGLRQLVAHDLRALRHLFDLGIERLQSALGDAVTPWEETFTLAATPDAQRVPAPLEEEGLAIRRRLAAASDWGGLVTDIADYIQEAGAGAFGRYAAFRWDGDAAEPGSGRGELVPVEQPDPVRLHDLVGYAKERTALVRNTERFVAGMPAHNLLLYGERGTGKSATVKAVLHEFAAAGLRMVELPRRFLGDLPRLLTKLRTRPQRVILFIDDLSFEEGEATFKELKAVLEGTLEVRPDNVRVYATTNRRHLVKEPLGEPRRIGRYGPQDDGEIRPRDAVEERLSLADRFGMTIIFPSPDQEEYLRIVEGIAERQGLQIPKDELRQRALQWAVWQNGRSARTAQQFIDELEGERHTEAR